MIVPIEKLRTSNIYMFGYKEFKGNELFGELSPQKKLLFLHKVLNDKTIKAGKMKVFYIRCFK